MLSESYAIVKNKDILIKVNGVLGEVFQKGENGNWTIKDIVVGDINQAVAVLRNSGYKVIVKYENRGVRNDKQIF